MGNKRFPCLAIEKKQVNREYAELHCIQNNVNIFYMCTCKGTAEMDTVMGWTLFSFLYQGTSECLNP